MSQDGLDNITQGLVETQAGSKQMKLPPEMVERLRGKALEDLYFFEKGILGFDLLDEKIHLPICRNLEDRSIRRRRFKLPRSWLKSTVCSIGYLIWRAIKDTNIRCLIVQNSHTNARKKLAVIRGKFEKCAMLRLLFPECIPTKDETVSVDVVSLPRSEAHAEGTFETAGTRTKLTSRHYNIIVEDDTVAPDLDDMTSDVLLPSQDDVEQAIGFHRNCLPLLVNIQEDEIMIVGTRWFERDLLSWSEENEKQYSGISRAVKETDGRPDEDGAVAWPERFGQPVLDEIRVSMGEYLYNCLYMNTPISAKGMVFQNGWFKEYQDEDLELIVTTTVDLATPPDENSGDIDYNVVLTTGKSLITGKIFVLHYWEKRCSPSEVIDEIFHHVRMYKPIKVGIESIAYQKAMITFVKERMRKESTWFMVEPLTHGRKSKYTRICGLEPFVKSGMLVFKSWMSKLRSQLLSVSRDRGILSPHDDIADALAMQIPLWVLTQGVDEEKQKKLGQDPLSFDSAVKEIEIRYAKRRKMFGSVWAGDAQLN